MQTPSSKLPPLFLMDIRGQCRSSFLILFNNNSMLFRKQLLFQPRLLLYILAAIFTQCVPDCAFRKLCILKRWNNSTTFPQAVNEFWGYYLSPVGNKMAWVYPFKLQTNNVTVLFQNYTKSLRDCEISFSMVFITSLWDPQWLTKLMARSQGPIFQSAGQHEELPTWDCPWQCY